MAFPKTYASELLQSIEQGDFEHDWYPLPVTPDLTVYVSTDALKVKGVRVNVTAILQQQIADRIGGRLLTTEISDLMWVHGDRITPSTRSIVASIEGMKAHSKDVDTKLEALPSRRGLTVNAGKHWVLDNMLERVKPNHVINYGWYLRRDQKGDLTPSLRKITEGGVTYPLKLIQSRGTFHDWNHIDYSQTCTLVNKVCTYQGAFASIDDILTMERTPLTFDGKPLKFLRIPSVEEYTGPVILPGVTILA